MKYLIAFILVSFLSPNIVFGYDDKEILKHIIENELYQDNEKKAYDEIKDQFDDISRDKFKTLFLPVKEVFDNAALFLNPKTRETTRAIIKYKIYEEDNKEDAWELFEEAGFVSFLKIGIDFLKTIWAKIWPWVKKSKAEIATAIFSIIYDSSVNNETERFDKIDKGLEKINDKLDRQDKKIDRIDERSERNDRRLDELENK